MTNDRPDILGMRFLNTSQDAFFTSLPLAPGLTVLQGQNGSGKSTVLHHLRGALTGQATRFPTELYVRGLPTVSTSSWEPGLPEGTLLTPQDPGVWDAAYEILRSAEQFLDGRWWSYSRADLEDLLSRSLFCVKPVGGPGQPTWEVWLAAPTDHPILADQAAQLDVLAAQVRALRAEVMLQGTESVPEGWTVADVVFEHLGGADLALAIERSPLFALWLDFLGGVSGLAWPSRLVLATGDWYPHDGMPIPFARLGVTHALDFPQPDIEFSTERANRLLGKALGPPTPDTSTDRIAADLVTHAQQLSTHANTVLDSLLLDPPTLQATVSPFSRWLTDKPVAWKAQDGADNRPRDPHEMSTAQSRWSLFSACQASIVRSPRGTSGLPRVTVIDEPEAALHRTAESHNADGLAQFITEGAQRFGDRLVVATHSPHLIDLPGAHVFVVNRGTVAPYTGLEELGHRPSAMLDITRTILLVEGVHDDAVLHHLIGDDLRAGHVLVLPLHGGKRLAGTVDSQILFRSGSYNVVALLDNLDPEHLEHSWLTALALAALGDDYVTSLRTAFPRNSEDAFMRQWLIESLKANREHLITPRSLRKGDIIEYLPITALVAPAAGQGKSWDDLRAEHAEALMRRDGAAKDFKQWIRMTYKVGITDEEVDAGAASMDEVPDEFVELGKLLRAMPRL